MMRSTLALAGLAASVVAESSSCPLTTTITSTATYKWSEYVTVTTLAQSPRPTVTETPTDWVTTGTTTVTEPFYEETCSTYSRYVPLAPHSIQWKTYRTLLQFNTNTRMANHFTQKRRVHFDRLQRQLHLVCPPSIDFLCPGNLKCLRVPWNHD
jgi:hypothetical protein